MSKFISNSEKETIAIAHQFAGSLVGGDVVALSGELGSGKTAFTKGIARALGVEKEIVSPTFGIMNVYDVNLKSKIKNLKSIKQIVHIDTYRLKSADELYAIGADEYIGAHDTVTIIEWPEIAEPLFANLKKIISVSFLHGKNPNERIITIENKSF